MESITDFLATITRESRGASVTIALILIFLALLYWYSVFPYSVLARCGIRHPKPWPFFGNIFLFRKGFLGPHNDLIKRYGRVCGYYLGRRPVVVIADPDVLKQIMVKEFASFPNRMVPEAVASTRAALAQLCAQTRGIAVPSVPATRTKRWKASPISE